MNDRLELVSPLPPAECARRLTAAIDLERSPFFRSGSWRGTRPVIGQVEGLSVRLRKRIGYNNGFQNFLIATMEPSGGGTRIQGDFAMHSSTRLFSRFWIGGVIVFAAIALAATVVSTLSPSPGRHVDWMIVVIPLIMLVFGSGLIRFGQYLARDEASFLTRFLCETLQAKENGVDR